jgi:hypothetical protein
VSIPGDPIPKVFALDDDRSTRARGIGVDLQICAMSSVASTSRLLASPR